MRQTGQKKRKMEKASFAKVDKATYDVVKICEICGTEHNIRKERDRGNYFVCNNCFRIFAPRSS